MRAARGSEDLPPRGDRGGTASALQGIALVDWDFNGWGNKYSAALDNEIPTHVAAILGGVAAGAWPDVHAALAATVRPRGQVEPVAEWVEVYREARERYARLYPALREVR